MRRMGFKKQVCAILAILTLGTGTSSADFNPNYSKLWLSIQKDGMPLFKSVDMIIYKLGDKEKQAIYSSQRHTAVVDLRPGYYLAEVAFNGEKRRQVFELKTMQEKHVVLDFKQQIASIN